MDTLANNENPDEMPKKYSILSGFALFAEINKNNLQGQKYIIIWKFQSATLSSIKQNGRFTISIQRVK